MSVHTTGVPCAIASSTGMPKPSCRLGNTNRSAPAKSGNSCSRSDTGPSSCTRSPSRRTAASASSGFHPAARRARGGAARRLVEPGERVEQRAHVLARLERARPRTRTGGRRARNRLHHTVDVLRRWRARRSTPLGTTRMRSRGIGVCVAISSALNSDTAITSRARFAAAAKPWRWNVTAPAGERLGHHERRGVVHGDDEGDAARTAAPPVTARARGRPAPPAARDPPARARARRRRARAAGAGARPGRRHRGRARQRARRRRRAGAER